MSTRTIRSLGIEEQGRAYFFSYEEGPPPPNHFRLDTLYTGISAGTELTFLHGTNPYLHAHWDDEFGLFHPDEPSTRYPVPFMGYMEVGRVTESRAYGIKEGDIVAMTYGHKSGHTADAHHEFYVPASLQMALRALRPQGAVIDLAFYQAGAEAVRLGEEFHHNGLTIRCAQIGRVPRGLGHAWNRQRLADATIDLLRAYGPQMREQIITDVVPYDEGPTFLARLATEYQPQVLQAVLALRPARTQSRKRATDQKEQQPATVHAEAESAVAERAEAEREVVHA